MWVVVDVGLVAAVGNIREFQGRIPSSAIGGGVFTTFFAVTFPKLVREALKAILFLTSFCIRCFNFQSEAGFFFPQGATGERRGFHGRAGFPEVTYVPHHCG